MAGTGGAVVDAVAQASGLRLEKRIGAGGAAEVFHAHDERLDRPVALKAYLRPITDEETRTNFDSECRLAARAGVHPQIATIYGAGVTGGTPWLAMQLFEGGSLAQRLRSGALSTVEALQIAIVMADTLRWAHEQSPPVLHRDVKPGNILLDGSGRPTLSDFGIACVFDGTSSTSISGFTPIFSAPEVLTTSRYGVAAEVWSLTAVLYQMLTGTSPFSWHPNGGISAYLDLVRQAGSAPRLPAGYPDSLRRLIVDGLSADVARRPASMQAFGQRLRSVERELGFQPTQATMGPGQMPDEQTTRGLGVVVTPGSEPARRVDDDGRARTVPRAPRPYGPPPSRPVRRAVPQSPPRGLVASAPIYQTAVPVRPSSRWSRLPQRKLFLVAGSCAVAGVAVLVLLLSGAAGAVAGHFTADDDPVIAAAGDRTQPTAGADTRVVPAESRTTPTAAPTTVAAAANSRGTSSSLPSRAPAGKSKPGPTPRPSAGQRAGPSPDPSPKDPGPTLVTGALPNGTVGVAYSAAPAAEDGTKPYTWSLSVGALPPGLSLSPSTGRISGTPTAADTSNLVLTVTDAKGDTSSQPLSITIVAAPVVPPSPSSAPASPA